MAADDLGIVGSGQVLAEEDQEKIDDRFDGLMNELSLRGIVTVSDDSEIPVEWCSALSELLANECSPTFGIPKHDVSMAEERLRIMVQRRTPSNRFLEVDDTLKSASHITYSRWLSGI